MTTATTREIYDAEQRRKAAEEKRMGLTDFDRAAIQERFERVIKPVLSIYKECK